MRVKIDIKPTMITADTKQELMYKISTQFHLGWISGASNGYARQTSFRATPVWYGINMEKRRRKIKKIPKGYPGYRDVEKNVVVRKACWVAWIYKIPSFMTIHQGSRTFRLVTMPSWMIQ